MAAQLGPEAAVGASTPQLAFMSSAQAVTVAGQKLKFASSHALLEPDETRWVHGSSPHGVALVATCPKARLFAFTEKTLEPKISVFSYPDFMPVTQIEFPTRLEFTAIAFSRDGGKLAALTGLPEPTLVVWDLKTQTVLASAPLLVPCESLSFNPNGDGSICTLAPKRLLVWKLKLVYKTYLLESKEVPIEAAADDELDGSSAANTWTDHAWSPNNALYASAESGVVVRVEAGEPTVALRCSSAVSSVLVDATHLIVGCADGSLRWFGASDEEIDEETAQLFVLSLEAGIKQLVYSPDYLSFLAATASGEAHLVKYLREELPLEPMTASRVMESEKVSAFHTSAVVAAATMPLMEIDNGDVGSYDIVTCSTDGTLRCIDALTRMQVDCISPASSAPPTCVATCGPSMLIAVGTADGVLRLYTRRMDQMPLLLLVWRGKLARASVQCVAFSASGTHLAASCADGTVIILSLPKGCDEPTILPHYSTGAATPPTSLAWTASGKLLIGFADGRVILAPTPSGAAGDEAKLTGAPSVVLKAGGVISLLEAPSTYDGASANGATTLIAACSDYSVGVYSIPKSGANGSKIDALLVPMNFEPVGKKPSCLTLSYDGLFLGVGSADGTVTIAPISSLTSITKVGLHDSVAGGTSAVCLVPDMGPAAVNGAAHAYTCGCDGTMFMTTVTPGGYGQTPPVPALTPVPTALRAVPDRPTGSAEQEAEAEAAAALMSPRSDAEGDESPGEDESPRHETERAPAVVGITVEQEQTVLERARELASMGNAESAARDAIGVKVEALREELLALIGANELLAEDDLEKLTPADFIIDQQQQKRWREEGTTQVEALKDSIRNENLAKELVTERMRAEFWTSMAAPAITLHSLAVPGQGAPARQALAKVTSFTVPKPLPKTTKALGSVKILRRVELLMERWEAADNGDPSPSYRPSRSFEDAVGFANGIGKVLSAAEMKAAEAGKEEGKEAAGKDDKKGDKKAEEKEEGDEEKGEGGEGEEGKEKDSDAMLLYKPFELHCKWRKVSQMCLNGEAQGQLKSEFNEKLKGLLNYKRAELEKIKEKQVRIGEIETELERLGSASDGEPTLEMLMNPDEEPEKLLEVNDDEITSKKWISPAERERLAKAEEERRLREEAAGKDNLGQRGLDNMMNGTLETRREEDAIFVDLVRPEWMDRPAEELSEDEKALVKEFEDQVKKLNAEREKRSKGLLTELAKLRLDIQDVCNNFNERVKALKDTKMNFDTALYESELLVIRLAQMRLQREAFEKHSTELAAELVTQKESAGSAKTKVGMFSQTLQAQMEVVEALTAEDKALDKAFKRDFADVPDFFEALKKLFLRRNIVKVPKGTKAGKAGADKKKPPVQQQGSRASAAMMVAVQQRPDAIAGEPSSADSTVAGGRDPFSVLDEPEMEDSTEGLDPAVDMPEGLSFDVWDRLVEARNAKVDAEEELKAASKILSEMQEYHNMLAADDDRLRSRIEVLSSTLDERKEQQLRGAWNLELPFKFKQGQVEVEEAPVVTDFGGAVLIHRDDVAGLNREIRKLGGEKVEILKEIRDFRKGIVQLEFENARSDMEAEDLVERTKEFQLLRVTKDLQDKIRGGGEDNSAGEVAALEKKLDQLKASHEDKVADLRRQVAKINSLIADRNNEMASLHGQIEQLEGSVLEREMIHEIQSQNADSAKDGFKRFEEVHMKRKLQTLVGMQTQEIGLLRDELDRLRRRTFPTFTHIDHRASADRAL